MSNAWSPEDLYYFLEGTHGRLWDRLGARPRGEGGVDFAVWAPNALGVSVIGDWNGWNGDADPMARDDGGTWQRTVPAAAVGNRYKYRVRGQHGWGADKADPFARACELPPATGSIVADLRYQWQDADWMRTRAAHNALDAPISVYEVHPGSWRRPDGRPLGWRELGAQLAEYVKRLGFTHIELMPVTEHPFYGSWGYQTTGYFAPTARYGSPEDFMAFVDHLHREGIGLILDWVPSHFPTDEHGLQYFDGTHLYEHADPRQGFHPEWKSSIFNYGRGEVSSFLISSALWWLEAYHVDLLRVDAVASMLYLDYARKDGEWIANIHGGNENLEAITFLRRLNEAVYREHPDTGTIAEESTAWPMVSRPTYDGRPGFRHEVEHGLDARHAGLFSMKTRCIHRSYHLGQLSFSLVYAFNENFVLPLSHDEVVYGKGSLLEKMPGDIWQKFAEPAPAVRHSCGPIRARSSCSWAVNSASGREWAHERELDWELLAWPTHAGVQALVATLNRLLRDEPALHERDFSWDGFEWLEQGDPGRTLMAFARRGADGRRPLVVAFNFTPVPRDDVLLGVHEPGTWRVLLDSDASAFGGSGYARGMTTIESSPLPAQGRPHSLRVTLPPLAAVVLGA